MLEGLLWRVYAGGSMLEGLRWRVYAGGSMLEGLRWMVYAKGSNNLADQIPPRLRRAGISSAKDCIRSTCGGCILYILLVPTDQDNRHIPSSDSQNILL